MSDEFFEAMNILKVLIRNKQYAGITIMYEPFRTLLKGSITRRSSSFHYETDHLSEALKPDDIFNARTVKTTGNGNCLYNSVSLYITGELDDH